MAKRRESGVHSVNTHRRTDGDQTIQLCCVLIIHPDTAMADSLTDGPGLVGAMDSINAPGDAQLHKMPSELLAPEGFFCYGPVSRRRLGGGFANSYRIGFEAFSISVQDQGAGGCIDFYAVADPPDVGSIIYIWVHKEYLLNLFYYIVFRRMEICYVKRFKS